MGRTPSVEQGDVPARHAEADAVLAAARAILANDRFEDSARAIFDLVKKLLGATGGYIAMLSPDGEENEVLFLDSGGRPCNVDPSLPMPIRGLRAEVYHTGRPAYDNNFAQSPWMDLMPDGHVGLDSVLFAPLALDGRVMGLLGLANKPGGFSDDDARTAGELSEFVALALKSSRDRASQEDHNRKQAEKRLTEQAAFMVNNPAPVLRVDHGGVILDMNPAATALLGAVLTGRPVRECLPALADILPASGHLAGPSQFEDVVGSRSFLFTVRHDAPTESYYVYGSDITERKALEKLVIEAGDTQRRRIGRDLHDTLGQNLTGLSFLIHGLAGQLSDKLPAQAEMANKIVHQVNDSIAQVRFLAKGLTPVGVGEDGLAVALGELAGDTESLFGISCVFHCDQPVAFNDESVTTQLYHIALEAVNNATKHARAEHITIMLASDHRGVRVIVADDGVGLPEGSGHSGGMGMHTMRYRAGVIGAFLRIGSGDSGGVTVTCTLPAIGPTGIKDHHE